MINVIGLGYIGLPTALMMASHGVEVIGTDYNKELVATLNAGHTTFKEDGLDELFQDAVQAGIKFTTEYQVTGTYGAYFFRCCCLDCYVILEVLYYADAEKKTKL